MKKSNDSKTIEEKNLPKIKKDEEVSPAFDEKKEEEKEAPRIIWIITLAFVLLASIGIIIWVIFSGRADQKIHGDNLSSLTGKESDSDENKNTPLPVSDHELNLVEYDSDILLSEAGDYTLKGTFDYSVYINSTGEVNLTLSGVTFSKSLSISNESENLLTLSLPENKINSLTSVFSSGDLIIKNSGNSNGRLLASSLETNKKLTISGGLIYLDGKESENSLKTASGLEINGGTIVILDEKELEKPLTSSVQKSLTVNFSKTVKKGSNLSFRSVVTGASRELDNVETDFKSIIYSAKDLAAGDYELLVDGEVVGTGTVE